MKSEEESEFLEVRIENCFWSLLKTVPRTGQFLVMTLLMIILLRTRRHRKIVIAIVVALVDVVAAAIIFQTGQLLSIDRETFRVLFNQSHEENSLIMAYEENR